MSDLLTLSDCEIEDMPQSAIASIARRRAKQVDDIILPLLQPWQRRILKSLNIDKWYMRPLVILAKRTADITIEHHRGEMATDGNTYRITDRIVVKQHGKAVR